MNFREQLLSELSRKNVNYVIHVVGDSEAHFDSIIELLLNEKDPLPARASWVAEGVSARYPELAEKHLEALIQNLPSFTHTGTRRNVLKMLCRIPIPIELQGILIDHCFEWMLGDEEPVAVKVFSMQIIANHLGQYPELRHELRAVIEDQYDRCSPGFRARGRKVLKMISAMS